MGSRRQGPPSEAGEGGFRGRGPRRPSQAQPALAGTTDGGNSAPVTTWTAAPRETDGQTAKDQSHAMWPARGTYPESGRRPTRRVDADGGALAAEGKGSRRPPATRVRCAVAEETDCGGAHTAQGTGDSPGTVHAELTSSYEPVSPINLVKKEPSPGRAAPPRASPAPRFHRRRLLYKRGRETDVPGKLFSGSAEAGLWGREWGPRGASPCALWAVIRSDDKRKHVRRRAHLHRAGGESALNFFLS